MATVDIDLIANTQKAIKSVQSFSSRAASAVGEVSNSFLNLRTAAIGALAGIGVGKFVKDAVAAAAQQEEAVQKLNTALALSGELSQENTQDFLDFASALQATSTVGDEVSLGLVGLAKSFGASNEQAKQILQTAADLSAVTGESLESSVRNLSKTLGGLKGELGETQPELRGLTAEQLQNGEAITILSSKYDGAAEALTKTFSGALRQTSNTFGDLLEAVGAFISESPSVIAAINLSAEVFNDLAKAISGNKDDLGDFLQGGLLVFTDSLPFIIRSVGTFVVGLKSIGAVLPALELGFVQIGLAALESFDSLLEGTAKIVTSGFSPVLKGIESVVKGLEFVGIAAEGSADEFASFSRSINSSVSDVGSALDGLIEKTRQQRDESKDALQNTVDSIAETAVSFENAALKSEGFSTRLKVLAEEAKNADSALKNLSDTNQKAGNSFRSSVTSSFKNEDPIKVAVLPEITDPDFITAAIKPENLIPSSPIPVVAEPAKAEPIEAKVSLEDSNFIADQIGLADQRANQISQFASIGTSILGGAEGARQALISGGSLAADALFPGAGQAVGPIIEALSKGPEFVRAQVKEFVAALPELLNNIAEALPVLIETVAENLDDILLALVKSGPAISRAIIISLVKAGPLIAKELASALLTEIDKAFGTGFAVPFDQTIEKWQGATEDLQEKYLSSVEDGAKRILSNLDSGINRFTSTFQTFFNSIVDGVKTAFLDLASSFSSSIGSSIESFVLGFKDGVKNIFAGVETPSFITKFGEQIDQLFAFQFPSGSEFLTNLQNAIKDIGSKFTDFLSGFDTALLKLLNLDGLKIDVPDFKSLLFAPINAFIDVLNSLKIPAIRASGSILGRRFDQEILPATDLIPGTIAKLQTGGRVPEGFPNDSFPAALTSGEEVLDTSTSQRLRQFLDGSQQAASSQPMQIILQVGEKQLADVFVNLSRQGFRLAP